MRRDQACKSERALSVGEGNADVMLTVSGHESEAVRSCWGGHFLSLCSAEAEVRLSEADGGREGSGSGGDSGGQEGRCGLARATTTSAGARAMVESHVFNFY